VVLAVVLAVSACGSGHSDAKPRAPGNTNAGQQLGYSRIGIAKDGQAECASQQLIVGWTLLVRGRDRCAASVQVQHVFSAYLGNAACLRRPAPDGTWCAATGGYRCVTWNWQDFPGTKTLVNCVARRGPKAATFFAAWSPRARQ
jgi:hypothetical protein